MKRTISFVIASVFALGLFTLPTSATDGDRSGIGTKATNYTTASAGLGISKSGTASPSGSVTGKYGVTTKISIHLYLQKYKAGKWMNVKDWTGTRTSTSYSLSKTSDVSKGKYRTKAAIKVYAGTKYEMVTKYSASKSY